MVEDQLDNSIIKYECISRLSKGGVHFWNFGILAPFMCCGSQNSEPNSFLAFSGRGTTPWQHSTQVKRNLSKWNAKEGL